MSDVHYKETEYGFDYGSASVDRLSSDDNQAVTLGITTPKDGIQVRVTKTGLIRVFSVKHGELHPKKDHLIKRRDA